MFKLNSVLGFIFLSLSFFSAKAQVQGTITNTKGDTLTQVNIYLENSFSGTTSNQNGYYELKLNNNGQKNLVVQYLGYETLRKSIDVQTQPFELNVQLKEQSTELDEVVLDPDKNPADRIIQKAIDAREENKARIQEYKADFYSKGLIKLKDVPEKIFGKDVDDSGILLDSTRSGIVYLSETFSNIKYRAPDDFYENITASKVSGEDRGISFNSAEESDFSFYDNTIGLNAEIASPIANYAFSYYDYKLESGFYTDNGSLVNKIKVIPKRPKDRVAFGYIYITEDDWQIYGVDLKTTGESTQIPFVDTLSIRQDFSFSESHDFWVKRTQNTSFSLSIFGLKAKGNFTAMYRDYNFNPNFTDSDFGNEVLSFDETAADKDSVFWQNERPIPLTHTETRDYKQKDSLKEIRNSKKYLDSVDREKNAFSPGDLLFGYTYDNSYENWSVDFSAPLFGTHFNTVQGWNTNVNLSFTKIQDEDKQKRYKLFSDMSYGFSDERFRVSGGFQKQFNNKSKPFFRIKGGIEATEINDRNPIPYRINDVANIFFERNYLKLYDRLFAEAYYSEEWFNGFRFYGKASYEKRKPLINSTEHVIVSDDNGGYTANNPLQPDNFGSLPFREHNMVKLKATARINFGQEYFNYPDTKINAPNQQIPTFYVSYEKGLGATLSDYNFDHLSLQVEQTVEFGNKGEFDYLLNGGTFFNSGDDMALVDFQHFKGNQFRVATESSYVGRFNLLPYYALSTNDNYVEGHLEHNFRGLLLGKIPYVNELNFNLVAGAKTLLTAGNKPYSEVSIGLSNVGFGDFRFLRFDYVHSFQGNSDQGAVVFGLQFLDFLE